MNALLAEPGTEAVHPVARRLLAELSATPETPARLVVVAPGGYGKTALLDALGRGYRAAGVEATLVDDADQLGEADLARLSTLATTAEGPIVLAHRPNAGSEALRTLGEAFGRQAPAIVLPPLAADEVAALAKQLTGRSVDTKTAAALHTRTGGVPRLVERVVTGRLPDFRAELADLDEDVLRYLIAAEAGAGRNLDLLCALLGRSPDRLPEVVDGARATGLLNADDALLPIAAEAVRTFGPPARRLTALQQLVELQLRNGLPVLDLAKSLLNAGSSGPSAAAAFAAAAAEALPGDAKLAARLFEAASDAGTRDALVTTGWARAAALSGDLDTALRLGDGMLSAADRQTRAAGAEIAATVLAHRGELARSAELYRWSARCAAEASPRPAGGGFPDAGANSGTASDGDAAVLGTTHANADGSPGHDDGGNAGLTRATDSGLGPSSSAGNGLGDGSGFAGNTGGPSTTGLTNTRFPGVTSGFAGDTGGVSTTGRTDARFSGVANGFAGDTSEVSTTSRTDARFPGVANGFAGDTSEVSTTSRTNVRFPGAASGFTGNTGEVSTTSRTNARFPDVASGGGGAAGPGGKGPVAGAGAGSSGQEGIVPGAGNRPPSPSRAAYPGKFPLAGPDGYPAAAGASLSREGHRWAGQGAVHAFAAIALVGTGQPEGARELLRAPVAGMAPTLFAGAAGRTADGIAESVTGPGAESLSVLLGAAAMLEPSGGGAPLPDSPAALAAIVGLQSGELGLAESVLTRALECGVGGDLLATRHRLLLGWVAMTAGDLTTAGEHRDAVAESGRLEARDELFFATLELGLARRASDLVGLQRSWDRAYQASMRQQTDLFTLLPLGELAIAAARNGAHAKLARQLDRAHAMLGRLGHPPLWTVTLCWHELHAAITLEDRATVEKQLKALTGFAGGGRYPSALAQAASCWLAVLSGAFQPDTISAAAAELHELGLGWDAARLAGQAAIRTSDRKAMVQLLEAARQFQGITNRRESPVPEPIAGAGLSALSERELEVARLVVDGLTYKQAGSKLFISGKTVEHHMARIRGKLGAADRRELLATLRDLLSRAGHS